MSVNLKQAASGYMGLQGVDADYGDIIYESIYYTASSPLTMTNTICTRSMHLHSVVVNPDVASTNAVTLTAYSAPSGTALGSGTALTGTIALNGTAGTNVSGVLVAGTNIIPAGTRVGVVISGALGAAGNGVITFGFAPS